MAALARFRPWVDDVDSFDRYGFQALAAAYVTVGAPPLWPQLRLDELVGRNQSAIADVAAVGAASDDEHVSKLVYSAHCRWAEGHDPLYLAVAARKAGVAE